ncbi:LexA family transcriptional regulator [Buttiauxella warmboldiae]|uniref:LexA family transcriptional regulator n=1 Tax=Buttiauxella warmboldiae TaxID=82993 RepID=A0A3N5DC45_9ENTR|nr:YebG family protein [Buttiauxella warmboldiae]RPH22879.1 LexA family transcriptional regulator [Buttiauxella warmboldiae]
MAVEIKYVVVREGQEKMSFASKKDADAYDKMLDLAEVLSEWLTHSPVALEEGQNDVLAMWMAENKDLLSTVLRSGKLPELETAGEKAEPQEADAEDHVAEHPRKRTKAA